MRARSLIPNNHLISNPIKLSANIGGAAKVLQFGAPRHPPPLPTSFRNSYLPCVPGCITRLQNRWGGLGVERQTNARVCLPVTRYNNFLMVGHDTEQAEMRGVPRSGPRCASQRPGLETRPGPPQPFVVILRRGGGLVCVFAVS